VTTWLMVDDDKNRRTINVIEITKDGERAWLIHTNIRPIKSHIKLKQRNGCQLANQ
jgi:hypothetical protein